MACTTEASSRDAWPWRSSVGDCVAGARNSMLSSTVGESGGQLIGVVEAHQVSESAGGALNLRPRLVYSILAETIVLIYGPVELPQKIRRSSVNFPAPYSLPVIQAGPKSFT